MTGDMTAATRITRAEAIVREQRDPNGGCGAVGDPVFGPVGDSALEALALQELERLQRAVLGEPDPKP